MTRAHSPAPASRTPTPSASPGASPAQARHRSPPARRNTDRHQEDGQGQDREVPDNCAHVASPPASDETQERVQRHPPPVGSLRWTGPLRVDDWTKTRETLHLWTQIVGKIRLAQAPMVDHWWQVTLYVTPRGLTTGPMPAGGRAFQIDFDFVAHVLRIDVQGEGRRTVALEPKTVAAFHAETMAALSELGIDVAINPVAVEPPDAIRLDRDETHADYDAAFSAYAYPEPAGYRSHPVTPAAASYSVDFSQYLLPYEAVRTAADPDAALLGFLQSTYEAGAINAGWDRAALDYAPVDGARPGSVAAGARG